LAFERFLGGDEFEMEAPFEDDYFGHEFGGDVWGRGDFEKMKFSKKKIFVFFSDKFFQTP